MTDFDKILCSDIFSFQLGVLGISITLFTVLYSFITANRDEMKTYRDLISKNDKSPILKQRNSFARKRIKKLKYLNNNVLIICIISFVSVNLSLLTKYELINDNFNKYLLYINLFATIIVAIYILVIFIHIVYSYFNSVKI